MRKLLVVCGPTAVGKTSLALHLARVFNGDLISADSRQVYKGLDIGTGKDIPKGFKFRGGCYTNGITRIYGYDLVTIKQEYSVSHFVKFAEKTLPVIYGMGKLPILVGGTGLYIKGVVDGIDTIDVPRDVNLRRVLGKKGVDELFEILVDVNSTFARGMNNSDRRNPRRLIRAIEIGRLKGSGKKKFNLDTLFIGLTLSKKDLDKKIDRRIKKRIGQGFRNELRLLSSSSNTQALSSLGYKQFPDVDSWVVAERRYAKRQMTWFKRDKRINWFYPNRAGCVESVEKLVKIWLNTIDAT